MKYIITEKKNANEIRNEFDSRLIEKEITIEELRNLVHGWKEVENGIIYNKVTIDICSPKLDVMYISVEEIFHENK